MKIVTLLFACIAVLNSSKIGARGDDDVAGRGSGGPASRNPQSVVGARNNDDPAGRGRRGTAFRNTQPEVGARNDGGPAGRGRGGATLLDTLPEVGARINDDPAGRGRRGTALRNTQPELGARINSGPTDRGRGGTALQNTQPVGARNDGRPAGRGRGGTALRNTQPEVDPRNNGSPVGRGRGGTTLLDTVPVLRAWADHAHTHTTEILNNSDRHPEMHIKRVVNGSLVDWHLLKGDLVPNLNIVSCNGPHGYAIVDFVDSERLYACIKPNMFHREDRDREHYGGVPVFLAKVLRPDMPDLEADLAPNDARSRLNRDGHLYRGEHQTRMLGSRRVGHVRYIKSDPLHPIDVEGDLYHFRETGEQRT